MTALPFCVHKESAMKWIKMEMKTTTEAVDLVSVMLADLGVEGIEISDFVPLSEEDKQKMFIDILPELPEDDGSATVSFYLDTDTDIEELKANIAVELSELRQFVNVGSGACAYPVFLHFLISSGAT